MPLRRSSNALERLAFVNATYPIDAILEGKATLQINSKIYGISISDQGNMIFSAKVTDSGLSSGIGSTSSR